MAAGTETRYGPGNWYHLVPLIFEPYATDLAGRLTTRTLSRVLEIAAGTGVVTRAMAAALPEHVAIVATDLNQAMRDQAAVVGTTRPAIESDLANGGFTKPARIATVAARSRAESCRAPAIAYCQGTPLRNEIEARDAARLGEATDIAAAAIAKRFGSGAVDGKIQAHIVTIEN